MNKENSPNTLSGMTGFSRVSGAHGDAQWTWEARSVNGKGLDVRLRLPADMSALDGPVRKVFTALLSRGNIQVSLDLKFSGAGQAYQINTELAKKLTNYAAENHSVLEIGELLQVPGVVIEQAQTREEDEQVALEAVILASAKDLAAQLKEARGAEGAAIAPLLLSAIDRIEQLLRKAEALADSRPEQIRQQLKTKLSELLGDDLPEERLAQEAAILAMKADVREELDRLVAHCAQARGHLAAGSPIGRKLDFLCQEFNRETNTLCAKSSSIALTRIGLELKSIIEQFREQAANAE